MQIIFHYFGKYKHFGYNGVNPLVNVILFSDFAESRPYVIRIRIKWLTKRFRRDACTDEIYPGTDTDDKNSPKGYLTCSIFYPDTQCGY